MRSLAGVLWAPLGRIRRIPAGTPLLSGKLHRFSMGQAHRPMLVWVGWWNCATFAGDPAEHFFVDRGSVRYALRASDLVRTG